MTDVAKAVADYLETNGVGTVGTDIFIDSLPGESDLPATTPALTVIESGGFDPEINADRKHFNPTVQIFVQGIPAGNVAAKALAVEVVGLMTDPLSLVVGDDTYYASYQQGGLNYLGDDENNRPEISLNFRLYRREDQ